MDNNQVVIILQIITMILTAINPLIISIAYMIKHISNSRCCGNELTMRNSERNFKTSEDSNIREVPLNP